MPKKSSPKPKMESQHKHFLAIIVIFAGFSLYAITSFFTSTDRYISSMYVSVVDNAEEVDVPSDCQTCPDTSVCDPVCVGSSDGGIYQIFTDVASDHGNAAAIEYLYSKGIISGYEDGSFKPDNLINRAELLTVLTNAVDADLSGNYSNCFTDVNDEWFSPFVCYAKQQGWVNGYADGSYKPAQSVIKAESLKIVLEALDYPVPNSVEVDVLPDVKATDWYAPYVKVALDHAILDGGVNFDATHQMTRAEFAEMLYRALINV